MSSIPTLALNGESIALKNMRVTISQQFQDKDQSGQTSATSKAEQGAKGKEMRVSGEVPFRDVKTLTQLFKLANATDAGGKRQVYRIAHVAARAVSLREATFTGMIDAPQQDGRMSWLVTFTLAEHLSVQEKKEARASAKPQAKCRRQAERGQVGPGRAPPKDTEKMTWFERRVLKPVNDVLE